MNYSRLVVLIFVLLVALPPSPASAAIPLEEKGVEGANEPDQSHSSNGFYALVANSYDGTITVFNVATGTVIDTITVGPKLDSVFYSAPGCVAVTSDDRWALIGYERPDENQLFVLAVETIADGIPNNEIIDTIDLGGTDPKDGNCIAITPDGTRAYVVGGNNGSNIAVVDLTKVGDGVDANEVSWISRGGAHHDSVTISQDGKRAYFTDYTDTVSAINIDPGGANDNAIIASVALGDDQTFMKGVASAPDGKRVYAVDSNTYEKLYVIDSDPASPTYHSLIGEPLLTPLGNNPYQVVVSPDSRFVYVSRNSRVSVVDVDPESPTYLTVIDTLTPDSPGLWGQGSMALTADGSTLLTVNNNRKNVSIYDTITGSHRTLVPAGNQPRGIALFRQPRLGPHVQVLDESDMPVPDAEVYRNGKLAGVSDEDGYVAIEKMVAGDELVALMEVHSEPSPRQAHAINAGETGWAFRTYVTSLTPPTKDHDPLPQLAGAEQKQVLRIDSGSVLVLFNLVVSIEWDASDGYIAEIVSAVRSASNYLYDASDGQMAFGHVTITDQGEMWRDADIQIIAGNYVRPHASVHGIFSEDRSDVVRLGRYWNGRSGNEGEWHLPDGFRTIVHELGHYALGMYDEYFMYGETEPVQCPVRYSELPQNDTSSASIMYYHYQATEFSALDVPGLWSDACTHTEQWRLNEESPWQTLVRIYSDDEGAEPANGRWRFQTPMDRGQALAGPGQLPAVLPDWPTIDSGGVSNDLTRTLQLTVRYADEKPAANAVVVQKKADGQQITQGLTDIYGRITVLGAEEGDDLTARIIGAQLAGQGTVDDEASMDIYLGPEVTSSTMQASPTLQLVPLDVSAENTTLLIDVENLPVNASPLVETTEPGELTDFVRVPLNPKEGGFTGTISFAAARTGTGHLRYRFDGDSTTDMLQTSFRLQQIANDTTAETFSDDGKLSLQLEPDSFTGNLTLLAITALRSLPGPLPNQKAMVGDAYRVTATAGAWRMAGEDDALLRLFYDPSVFGSCMDQDSLTINQWDDERGVWQAIESRIDDDLQSVAAVVDTLGTYVLFADIDDADCDSLHWDIYLPWITRN